MNKRVIKMDVSCHKVSFHLRIAAVLPVNRVFILYFFTPRDFKGQELVSNCARLSFLDIPSFVCIRLPQSDSDAGTAAAPIAEQSPEKPATLTKTKQKEGNSFFLLFKGGWGKGFRHKNCPHDCC